jgi:hypothetical protein
MQFLSFLAITPIDHTRIQHAVGDFKVGGSVSLYGNFTVEVFVAPYSVWCFSVKDD